MPLQNEINHFIVNNKVTVFSKTYCPHCQRAIQALSGIVPAKEMKVIQMDERSDTGEMQDILLKMTGARTVPRVFVDGVSVGGADETVNMIMSGAMKQKLTALGLLN